MVGYGACVCAREPRARYFAKDIVIVPYTPLMGLWAGMAIVEWAQPRCKCTTEQWASCIRFISALLLAPAHVGFFPSLFLGCASFVLVYLRRIFVCALFGARLRVFFCAVAFQQTIANAFAALAYYIAVGKQTCPKWSLHFHFIYSFAFFPILFSPFVRTFLLLFTPCRCGPAMQRRGRVALSSRFMRIHCEIFPLL